MTLDATRVTVLGGGRRKLVTTDRQGRTVDRYEVRWRAQLLSGGQREYRQRFDRAGDADEFIRRLKAVGLTGSTWVLDDEGRPVDRTTPTAGAATAREMTMWAGLLVYRAATWRGASGNGRRTAAPVLRAMAKTLGPGHRQCRRRRSPTSTRSRFDARTNPRLSVRGTLASPGGRGPTPVKAASADERKQRGPMATFAAGAPTCPPTKQPSFAHISRPSRGARPMRSCSRARPANHWTSATSKSVHGNVRASFRSPNPTVCTPSAATRSVTSPQQGGCAPVCRSEQSRSGAAGRTWPRCCAGTSPDCPAMTSSQHDR